MCTEYFSRWKLYKKQHVLTFDWCVKIRSKIEFFRLPRWISASQTETLILVFFPSYYICSLLCLFNSLHLSIPVLVLRCAWMGPGISISLPNIHRYIVSNNIIFSNRFWARTTHIAFESIEITFNLPFNRRTNADSRKNQSFFAYKKWNMSRVSLFISSFSTLAIRRFESHTLAAFFQLIEKMLLSKEKKSRKMHRNRECEKTVSACWWYENKSFSLRIETKVNSCMCTVWAEDNINATHYIKSPTAK